ncbi:hypothetical protein LINPERHAP2_LOCUS1961, partial [Linum perenne]
IHSVFRFSASKLLRLSSSRTQFFFQKLPKSLQQMMNSIPPTASPGLILHARAARAAPAHRIKYNKVEKKKNPGTERAVKASAAKSGGFSFNSVIKSSIPFLNSSLFQKPNFRNLIMSSGCLVDSGEVWNLWREECD